MIQILTGYLFPSKNDSTRSDVIYGCSLWWKALSNVHSPGSVCYLVKVAKLQWSCTSESIAACKTNFEAYKGCKISEGIFKVVRSPKHSLPFCRLNFCTFSAFSKSNGEHYFWAWTWKTFSDLPLLTSSIIIKLIKGVLCSFYILFLFECWSCCFLHQSPRATLLFNLIHPVSGKGILESH